MAKAQPVKARTNNRIESKKKRLVPVFIVLFSICLAVLGADLGLRVVGKRLLYYRPNEMFLDRWPPLPLVSRYRKNVRFTGQTFGDLAAMQSDARLRQTRQVVFETDAFGFRNRPAFLDDDVCDVIVLGDSFGAGLGTTQNRIWAAQLRRRYGVRAYNLSIPGGSPWQGYVHLASEIDRLRVGPDTLVLVTVFSGNDLDDYYYDRNVDFDALPWNTPLAALGVRAAGFARRSPILGLFSRLRHGNDSGTKVLIRELPHGGKMLFYQPYLTSINRTTEMVREHDNFPRLLDTIRDIRTVAEDHGCRMAVVLFPGKEEIYRWIVEGAPPWEKESGQGGLGRALKDSCKKDGIRFLDLKQPLVIAAEQEWKSAGDVIYWADDTHWNVKGHGIVADIIHGALLAPKPH